MKMKKLNDEELVKQLQEGSEAAFNEIYERYVKLVYFIAYKMSQNDADSKDIVQETFLEVKRAIHNLHDPNALKFWINRIAISKSKNLFRGNKYPTLPEDSVLTHSMVETRSYYLPDKANKRMSDKEVLLKFIDQLPNGQREVLILYYLEQYSIEEVAQILDCPVGTVKSRLSYARAYLKTAISNYEQENDISLNFHSLQGAIAIAYLAEFESLVVPSFGMGTLVSTPNLMKTITSSLIGKGVLAMIGVCIVGSGAVYAMTKMNYPKPQTNQEVSITKNITHKQNEFPELVVKGVTITSSSSAYFNLLAWACCEEEMQNLTLEELQEIQPVYDTLKAVNSGYYQSLLQSGWATAFENSLK